MVSVHRVALLAFPEPQLAHHEDVISRGSLVIRSIR